MKTMDRLLKWLMACTCTGGGLLKIRDKHNAKSNENRMKCAENNESTVEIAA